MVNLGVNANPTDAVVGFAIVGIVEFIKKYVPQINGGMTIFLCALLGGVAGLFGIDGLNVQTGILVGLGATGIHQVATAAGGK